MLSYIIRRLLLMIPTLLGITVVCFFLIQLVPGGPVEEILSQVQQASQQTGGMSTSQGVSAEEIELLNKQFGFDKPIYERYFDWLLNLLTFDLGESYARGEPVLDVILSKMPISLFFGLTSFLLSYLICIPLGVYKAVYHKGKFDSISSFFIFAGYVIPGYALGVVLIVLFSGGSFFDWFPLGGIVSDEHDEYTLFGQALDFLHHMVLPMVCFMLSEFAFLTFLMKNSLLDEIKKEYVLTARIKGASKHWAVWKHALRNALIPLATRLSEIFTLMFAGSLLIEKVFDIDGMGLLYYNAMIGRDYNLVMGLIFMMSVMTLLGRLFSDCLYVWLDPRIQLK
jgi:microcin C transport system permease protein